MMSSAVVAASSAGLWPAPTPGQGDLPDHGALPVSIGGGWRVPSDRDDHNHHDATHRKVDDEPKCRDATGASQPTCRDEHERLGHLRRRP